jgi:hypothetical protein
MCDTVAKKTNELNEQQKQQQTNTTATTTMVRKASPIPRRMSYAKYVCEHASLQTALHPMCGCMQIAARMRACMHAYTNTGP